MDRFTDIFYYSQRPYSIRTRIKTWSRRQGVYQVYVRDHIPLEQGLRLKAEDMANMLYDVRDHIPLEQGLRPYPDGLMSNGVHGQRPYSIRTRIKTGGVSGSKDCYSVVRDHIPLEQGLRR